MSIPHHPLQNREIKEKESSDVMELENQPETSEYFTELRCVKTLIYFLWQNHQNAHKICNICYANLNDEEKTKYTPLFPHNLVHKKSADPQKNCKSCKKTVVIIKPASECRGCILASQAVSEEYLDDGRGAPVFDCMEIEDSGLSTHE